MHSAHTDQLRLNPHRDSSCFKGKIGLTLRWVQHIRANNQ